LLPATKTSPSFALNPNTGDRDGQRVAFKSNVADVWDRDVGVSPPAEMLWFSEH
jgi:hypothetical protein